MQKILTVFLALTFSLSLWAQVKKAEVAETLPKYEIGSGAQYALTVGKDPVNVTIGFIAQTPSKLVLEIAMNSENKKEAQIKMVQQFHFSIEGGKIKIVKGLMKIPMIEKPQILPPEFLEGYAGGVQVKSFLISSKSEMVGHKVGVEPVVTPTKTYSTTHYHQEENGQSIDYWISDDAKPLGLIKMTSTGNSSTQNYKLLLLGPVRGVKAQINEADAEPLNDMAKMFLPLLIPGKRSP